MTTETRTEFIVEVKAGNTWWFASLAGNKTEAVRKRKAHSKLYKDDEYRAIRRTITDGVIE